MSGTIGACNTNHIMPPSQISDTRGRSASLWAVSDMYRVGPSSPLVRRGMGGVADLRTGGQNPLLRSRRRLT